MYLKDINGGLFEKTGFLWMQQTAGAIQDLPHNNPTCIAHSVGDESGPTTAMRYATQMPRNLRYSDLSSTIRSYGGMIFWEQGIPHSNPILLHPKDLQKNSSLSKEWGYKLGDTFQLKEWRLANNNGLEYSEATSNMSLNYPQETLDWLIQNVNSEDLSPTFFE
jgi:hypothetical protein